MLSLLYLVVKAQHYFVTSSYMFLDEKTVLEIWLNPWLNLTIFRGTGPRGPCFVYVPARKGLSRLGKNASASREVRERKNQPRPQGFSLKKWVEREKVLFQLRRKTFLAPLEFNLCFLARYQVNTANHLFSVFLFHYGVFSNITPFWEAGAKSVFFVIND